MPQLDFATFFSQYFWLVIIFLGFYAVLTKYYLPRIARTKKLREYLQRGADIEFQSETSQSNRFLQKSCNSNAFCSTGMYWQRTKEEAGGVFSQTKGVYAARYSKVFMHVLRVHKKAVHVILPLVTRPHRFSQLSKRYFLTYAIRKH